MSYSDLVAEDIRLELLRLLAAENGYTAHEHLLRRQIALVGHRLSADALRAHLAWLDEQGLLILMGDSVAVARLTQRGDDVASGAARCPGVARPRPAP